MTTWDDIIELREQLYQKNIEYYMNESVLSPNWWVLLITLFIILITWIVLVDKRKLFDIVTYGLLVALLSIVLDTTGVWMLLWSYPIKLTPIESSMFSIHLIHMPFIYMLVYQYFTKWKPFLIVMTVTAFIFAFILEPLLIWLQIYEIYKWSFYISFPIYIAIAAFFKWLIEKMKQVQERHIT